MNRIRGGADGLALSPAQARIMIHVKHYKIKRNNSNSEYKIHVQMQISQTTMKRRKMQTLITP